MTEYVVLNTVLGMVASGVAMRTISSLSQLRLVASLSASAVVLGLPWDYMALGLGAWAHGDPGPRIFTVPVNDLVLIFLMTFTTSSLVSGFILKQRRSGQATSEEHGK